MSKTRATRAGILVIDKPDKITSFGVIKAVRLRLGIKKIGHTGTLDPMATGVLPLCLGEATKIAGLLLAEDKAYQGTALLGIQTDTLDVTGEVLEERNPDHIVQPQVETILEELGKTELQSPPSYSAIRVGGERAYKKARRGETVEIPPRPIKIHHLELLRWDPPRVEFLLECSKGTYVRSLVEDLGQRLGCGATLAALRRTRCGSFDLSQSVTLPALEDADPDNLPLVTMNQALSHLALREIAFDDAQRFFQGQPTQATSEAAPGLIRVHLEGELVALGEYREGRLWPKRVFARE